VLFSEPKIPQSLRETAQHCSTPRFSALQRAENSSIRRNRRVGSARTDVSVLFSEPKIPQCSAHCCAHRNGNVSVLFSEPKIPQ